VAVGALASSIVKGPDWGWVSVGDVASFVVAAAALIFVRRQDGPSSVAGHRTGAVASADFRVVEPDVDSNGRSAQSVISSSTLSVIRLIVSLLTEAP
jgi:hypothetical protein